MLNNRFYTAALCATTPINLLLKFYFYPRRNFTFKGITPP